MGERNGKNLVFWPNAPRTNPMRRAIFQEAFGGLPDVSNSNFDSSLEIYLSLISNPSGIVPFGVHLPCQKSNLPRLVKMSRMRLPQGRVLLKSTLESLTQLQIELMIAHWKYICVKLSFDSSSKSFGQTS